MDNIFSEKNGTRKFERISRWNAIDYTIISRSNRLAQYADNYDSKDVRLNITCFKYGAKVYALKKFARFDTPIILEDRSTLSRLDTEDNLYLEINGLKTKVRLYREVT